MVPKDEVGAILQAYIGKIGTPLGAPQFVPHITLAGSIRVQADELSRVKQSIEELAQGIGSFSVSLAKFGMLDEEKRSLFLHAESEGFEMAYTRAASVFPGANVERFKSMPHLSVLYGMYPSAVKEEIIAENPLSAIEFNVDSFDLYRTNSDKATWKLEQEFPLST
jgi:2'-5' RNA ligase